MGHAFGAIQASSPALADGTALPPPDVETIDVGFPIRYESLCFP